MIYTFLHVENVSWKGVYLDGKKISDGYFNLDEIAEAERQLTICGNLLGFRVKRLEKDQDWFSELGGVLPEKISFHHGVELTSLEKIPMVNFYNLVK